MILEKTASQELPTQQIDAYISSFNREDRRIKTRAQSGRRREKMGLIAKAWTWWWRVSNDQDATARSVLTIVIVVLIFLWHAFRPKNRLPPGPPAWPLVGNLLDLPSNLHEHFTQLSGRYGPILRVRLGRKLTVVVSSPSIAKDVLKDQDVVFANRDAPLVAKIISYNGSDIAWGPYGPAWRLVRGVCVRELLNSVSLNMLYEIRRCKVHRMLARIRSMSGTTVNIGEQLFACTLDATATMLWGGTLVGEDGGQVGAELRRLIGETTELLGVPNVSDFFPILAPLDLQGRQRQMTGIRDRFDGIFDSMIEKRLEKGEKGNDFLGFLLKMKEEGDKKTSLSPTQLKGILFDLVVGGTDTTACTVEWAMTELLKNPEVMRKAQQEIEEAVGRDQHVEESHLTKLPYLRAVIKEVLRLHPIVPLLVPHSPSSPSKVAGFDVPMGTSVIINVWAIHRDPKYWDNPLLFDPERFLIGQPNLDFNGRDFHYIPFGSGRRICAGIALAERMTALILASLIYSFNWHVAEGEKPDTHEKFGLVLKKANPLFAIPSARSLNL